MNQLSYDVFLSTITEVNKISGHFLDTNGKQLVFAVKKGTDSSFLWKATVRIACVKIGKKYALKDMISLLHQIVAAFGEVLPPVLKNFTRYLLTKNFKLYIIIL